MRLDWRRPSTLAGGEPPARETALKLCMTATREVQIIPTRVLLFQCFVCRRIQTGTQENIATKRTPTRDMFMELNTRTVKAEVIGYLVKAITTVMCHVLYAKLGDVPYFLWYPENQNVLQAGHLSIPDIWCLVTIIIHQRTITVLIKIRKICLVENPMTTVIFYTLLSLVVVLLGVHRMLTDVKCSASFAQNKWYQTETIVDEEYCGVDHVEYLKVK